MKKLILFLFIFFVFAKSPAQQTQWTLEKCIEYALDHNLEIKQYILQNQNNQELLQQSKLNLLPNLNGGANHGYNWGQTVDRYTNAFATTRVQTNNFYVGTQLTLWDGLQKINQIRQNKAELDAGKYDLDKLMDDISLSVATAYLQMLFYNEAVKTAEAQVDITQQQVDRLRKMVTAGATAVGDLYNIEAQLATERVALIDAQNNMEISKLTLVQLLDLPSVDGFQIEIPNLELNQASVSESSDQVYNFAVSTQPIIKSSELKVKSSEYALAMARGGQSPSLTFGASIGTGYSGAAQMVQSINQMETPIGYTKDASGNPQDIVYYQAEVPSYIPKPFKDQISDNVNKSATFTLNIPIFNGWATRTQINRAKIGVESAKLTLDQNKLQLRKIIQQAHADAVAALNKYQAAQVGVDASKESFHYSEQKFNVGLMNSVDYNNSKKDYEKALSDLLRAKYDFIFKTTVLDFYMGKPITLKRQ